MITFINALGLLVGAYVVFLICSAIYSLYFHALAQFPGPALWAVSRIPWAYHTIKGDLWQVLHNFHEQYGPTVRIAPDELTTISPAAWKDVYTSKPLLAKDPHSQTQPLNGAHSLFTAEGDTHRRIRAAVSNTFSEKALRAQAPIIENFARQLVARVQRESSHHEMEGIQKVDLTKLYGYAAFDTITDLSLGEPLCPGLEDLNEHGWVQGYFFHAKFSAIRIALSRFSPMDKFLGIFLLGVTRKARERNWRIISAAFNRRMTPTTSAEVDPQRVDLLTPLVDHVDESGQKGVTKAESFTNGLAFVIAGTQLNTNVVSTATYLLLQHRTAWQRLSEEMVIGINVQNIQNATSLWVEPRKFHPERFLDASSAHYDTRFDADVKEAFAPFSVGPRNCIGYK
ncbi:cytochrome P450 [Diaporthe helianthi]|uniref:Cytochrome P450 n=1 Tax=Diaporthe helianthi TaxID=158607 RepID=A0A2P5HQZ8_DIAHE|nr:cytochrome P450 [Diaporthe helianthi]